MIIISVSFHFKRVSFHLREKIYFFADKINDRLYIRLVRIRGVKFMEVAIVDDEKVIREQIKKLAVKYETAMLNTMKQERSCWQRERSLMCYSLIFRWRA